MPDETDLDNIDAALVSNVQGPAKASDDTGSMEQHSLPDQIAMDRYLSAKRATRNGAGFGIKIQKIIAPNSD